jgi:hypothetical protein
MNYQELVEKLNEIDFGKNYYDRKITPAEHFDDYPAGHHGHIDSVGAFEVMQHYGGEDMGSNYFNIIHFKEHNVYIKFGTYYSSYDELDWDDADIKQVFPKEVTRIEFTTEE